MWDTGGVSVGYGIGDVLERTVTWCGEPYIPRHPDEPMAFHAVVQCDVRVRPSENNLESNEEHRMINKKEAATLWMLPLYILLTFDPLCPRRLIYLLRIQTVQVHPCLQSPWLSRQVDCFHVLLGTHPGFSIKCDPLCA